MRPYNDVFLGATEKLTGGVALYTAHIRQMDRQSGFVPGKGKKKAFRSVLERDV
jgi:hypothetical protein